MSATLAASPAAAQPVHSATPTFFGIVRGELFKVSKQRATWFAALVLLAINFLPYLVELSVSNLGDRFGGPQALLYDTMGTALTVFRVFVGPFLIIVTARLIGMEYSSGTIRVLLSRGVGRLQLLGAKMLAVFAIAAATLVAGLLFHFVMAEILFASKANGMNIGQAATAQFWTDTRTYILTVAISMVVTILMAMAVTVLGRSLAIGLAVGVSFFAADNIGLIFFVLANALTGSTFWLNVTALLLGPNLNAMPGALLPNVPRAATRVFEGPLVPVDGTHTFVVAAVWSLAFIVIAAVLTWRRDVKE